MSSETYNGWTNYETWLVSLWMDNEQGDYEYWREAALECIEESEGTTRSAIYELSKLICERFEEMNPLADVNGPHADLLNAALSSVDWYEIASHWIENTIEENV